MFILRFLKFLLKIIARLIRWFLRSVLKIVVIVLLIVSLLTMGGYVYVRERFEFDPYDTVKYSYVLAEEVDETALCPNAFNPDDMAEVQLEINSSIANMITYVEGEGYSISFGELGELTQEVKISDRQLGALVQKIIEQETESIIQTGGYNLGFELKQIDFSEVEDGRAELSTVVKIDMTAVVESMVTFPATLLKNRLPEYVYISSKVLVEIGETGFDYTLTHRTLTVNNLDDFQTQDLFRMLDVVMGTGKADQVNVQISEAIMGVLIGSEEQNGLVYSLKDNGATGFNFVEENEIEYLIITKNIDAIP